MPLKERLFGCPNCGHTVDRDLNAANNINRWFNGIFVLEREKAVSSTVLACGVGKPSVSYSRATVKQEINSSLVQLSLF